MSAEEEEVVVGDSAPMTRGAADGADGAGRQARAARMPRESCV